MQGPNNGFDSIYTNRKKGAAFEDGGYARAVWMPIDRKPIADQIFYGTRTPGYGTIAPSHFAPDPNFKPFERADPAGAKALIQQIGKPLQFEMVVTAGSAQDLQIAQLIQAQLLKADLNMASKPLEFVPILAL